MIAKNLNWPKVSIIVATFNNVLTLKKTVNGLLNLDYPEKFEIIVVNDGSSDNTEEMMKKEFGKNKTVRFFSFEKNQGVCKARNTGISSARFPIIINMDHDCIPEKDWLKKMVLGFDSDSVGVVSAYGGYGGTSTGFRKELLEKVGGYDESYRYYREDTDLSFKILDLGYSFKTVKADYEHDHQMIKPAGFWSFAKHVWQRLVYHQNDVLLYKKHPTNICKEFLHIRYGFLVDPFFDFSIATGLWQKNGKLGLSSPRGITFIGNKSFFHALVIVLGGIGYVLAVKTSRFIGSIRFGKLLL